MDRNPPLTACSHVRRDPTTMMADVSNGTLVSISFQSPLCDDAIQCVVVPCLICIYRL